MFQNFRYDLKQKPFMMSVHEGDQQTPEQIAAAASAEAAITKRITEAVAAEVSGLKTKNEELLGKMTQQKDLLKQFEGLDPTVLKEMKARLDADEDVKLLAEGKKEMVIEKYTQRMRAEHQAQLEAAEERVKAEAQRADIYKGSVLDNQIRAVTAGMHPGAVEDALLHARTIFSLDAKGKAVKLDSEGRPELGKDGSSPFSPAEWIETQKELKPHWFPAGTSGSGSGSARDGGSGAGKTITRSNFDKLLPLEQAKVGRSGIKIVD